MIRLEREEPGRYWSPDDPLRWPNGGVRKRWSVTEQEAKVLSLLAHGRKVLEVGTGLGISARAMVLTARSVTTIDPDPWIQESVELPGVLMLADWPDERVNKYDMIFIDGDHEAKAVQADLTEARKRLAPGGFMAFHDYVPRVPGVMDGLKHLDGELILLGTLNRLALYIP